MFKDCSLSALVSAFVAALVGITSSVALIFQAAQLVGASPEQTASWLWAVGIGIAVPTILFSVLLRVPVLIAWSTPGAAVIASAAAGGGLTLPQAIGAFVVSSALMGIAGFTGGFEKLMAKLPLPLAAALLAGVLARFATDAFAAVLVNPWLVLSMFVAYGIGRQCWPRYHVPWMLLLGIGIAYGQGLFRWQMVPWQWTVPVWVTPQFSVGAVIGTALPLFLVTMASQNLPGVSVFLANHYRPPVSRIIGWTGVVNLLLAPFGCFALNLAAITASFCLGPEAHPDPAKRYWSAMLAGGFYLLVGLFGATVAGLFAAFPRELVLATAGLALLGTIGNALTTAVSEDRFRESAIVTFFVTLSGVSLAGIGSAFWGMVAGGLVLLGQMLKDRCVRQRRRGAGLP